MSSMIGDCKLWTVLDASHNGTNVNEKWHGLCEYPPKALYLYASVRHDGIRSQRKTMALTLDNKTLACWDFIPTSLKGR